MGSIGDLDFSVKSLVRLQLFYLKKRNPMAILTLPNVLKESNMQVALPAIEINRLNNQFGIGTKAISAIAILIMVLSFASIFISVFDNMQARKYELALMRTMGGSPLLFSS